MSYINLGRLQLVTVCISLTAALGCSGSHPASVSGVVTLDGQPLTTGTVTFHPVGGGAAAIAQIQSDGRYELNTGGKKGLEPGQYKVTVFATEALSPDKSEDVIPKVLTPEQYGNPSTTPLAFEVNRGENDIPIPVKSPSM